MSMLWVTSPGYVMVAGLQRWSRRHLFSRKNFIILIVKHPVYQASLYDVRSM